MQAQRVCMHAWQWLSQHVPMRTLWHPRKGPGYRSERAKKTANADSTAVVDFNIWDNDNPGSGESR
jgi:hypothetical protein